VKGVSFIGLVIPVTAPPHRHSGLVRLEPQLKLCARDFYASTIAFILPSKIMGKYSCRNQSRTIFVYVHALLMRATTARGDSTAVS
jgi:hypothetical protein